MHADPHVHTRVSCSTSECTNTLDRIGSVSHYIEAVMAVGVCTLCIYLLIVLCRLCSLHTINLGAMDMHEMKIKTKCEQTVKASACVRDK